MNPEESQQLKDFSIANSPKPEITPEGQAAAGRIAAAREARNAQVQPTISANALATPVEPVNPPTGTPPVNNGKADALISSTAKNFQNIIRSESENARRAKEIQEERAALTGSSADFREDQNQQFGLPDFLREYDEVGQQLTAMDEARQKRNLAIGTGNSIAQGNREITQNDREAAIEASSLAARAQFLQGNIEIASTLVSQAVQDFNADRVFRNQQMTDQLTYFQGLADEETSQLLEQEKRAYEEDQAMIERTQKAVDQAMQTGSATEGEVAMLTSPETTDEERLALSQLISARSANEIRGIEMQSARTDLAIKARQLAKLREPLVATRQTDVIDINGEKQLIDTQTGEIIATFGLETSVDEITMAKDAMFVNTLDSLKDHPGLNTSVGPTALTRIAGIDAFGNKDDFIGSVENVVRTLTLNTFAEAKEKGMTFGAMSQGEWDILSESASKIAQWRVYDKEGVPGFRRTTENVAGYDIDETNFKKELDVLSNFGKMDALRKGAKPEDIGVTQTDDGLFWSQNSDGSFTQLTITPR